MPKQNITFPVLDAVSAIFAGDEYQEKLVKQIDPKFDRSGHKPSQTLSVHTPPRGDQDTEYKTLPSVSEFAKKTLGVENKWMHDDACAVLVTDAHRAAAQEAIDTINNQVMMMVLQGKEINSFIANIAKTLELAEISPREIGLLTFIPRQANQYKENARIDEKKTEYMQSKPLGAIGDKVFVTVTVFNTRDIKSQDGYESILHECHDDDGNLVTFFKNSASKGQFEIGKTYNINGRVKAAAETPYSYGAIVNTINYVRMTK